LLKSLGQDPRVSTVRDYSDDRADPTCSYPVVAIRVAQAISRDEIDRTILVCGTGIGMSISANKVPGVRAAVVHDGYSAERSVLSSNCQVMTLGSRIIAEVSALRLVNEWLGYEFDPASPSAAKLQVIKDYETALERARD
jgi:ribose 5-phosphate isomerase B